VSYRWQLWFPFIFVWKSRLYSQIEKSKFATTNLQSFFDFGSTFSEEMQYIFFVGRVRTFNHDQRWAIDGSSGFPSCFLYPKATPLCPGRIVRISHPYTQGGSSGFRISPPPPVFVRNELILVPVCIVQVRWFARSINILGMIVNDILTSEWFFSFVRFCEFSY